MRAVMMTSPPKRVLGPPAVWTAFAAQGRWKNWVMVLQLGVLALLTQVCFALAGTAPDVIVVDELGSSRYVDHTVTSAALVRFLDSERKRPTDLTLAAFTERFVRLTSGVNSATIDESWTEALSMMALPLAEKMGAEAKAQKLVETYRLAQVRTTLAFEDVQLVERKGEKAHLRALLTRQRTKLFSAELVGVAESQVVDLVLAEVPRTRRRPDGLEVLEWHTSLKSEAREGAAGGPSSTPTSGRPGATP